MNIKIGFTIFVLCLFMTACFTDEKKVFILSVSSNSKAMGEAKIKYEQKEYKAGDEVELLITTNPGFYFKVWEGKNGSEVKNNKIVMNDNKEIIAVFEKAPETFSVTINIDPIGKGKYTLDPLKERYTFGDKVKINLTPDSGYSFLKWEGNITTTNNTISVDKNIELTAILNYNENKIPFKIENKKLTIWDGRKYNPIFVKGINLGVGTPKKFPGEVAITAEQYANWFPMMAAAGFNAIRIYTIHSPAFYDELYKYNSSHPEAPLYIFQGVWLEEEERGSLYLLNNLFRQEIRDAVDCVHGNNVIAQRFGKAYGTYTSNISKWVIGYLVGREVMALEVQDTDTIDLSKTSYKGKYYEIDGVNPATVFFVENVDYITDYENTKYNIMRPASVSSWPTLDPMTHSTEPKTSHEDVAMIDMDKIKNATTCGGFFMSYHCYPYFPNFVFSEPGYMNFYDELGINSYLGYITDLINQYKNIPVMIAEYGVPSSWGNAHTAPSSGMNHGGLTEKEQGIYNARMLQNIYDTGYIGGITFAWMDEWFKNTWITGALAFPREKYPFWNDITSPEKTFGLIAFEPVMDKQNKIMDIKSGNVTNLDKLTLGCDLKFFYLTLDFKNKLIPENDIVIGLDTYSDDLGESILPNSVKTINRNELSIVMKYPYKSELMVNKAYDLYGISARSYTTEKTDGAGWNLVKWKNKYAYSNDTLTNYFPERYHEIGILKNRLSSEPYSSLESVVFYNNKIEIRIPWTMMQFSDPSVMEVINGYMISAKSTGVGVSISCDGELAETGRYSWEDWGYNFSYTERKKESLDILSKKLKTLD